MLSLGVPEQAAIRHQAKNFTTMLWAQTYQDQETEKMFSSLENKVLERA